MELEKISRYLKFGFTNDIEYGDTTETIDIEWEEAKSNFLSLIISKLKKDYIYAYSGTSTATMYMKLNKGIKTVSLNLPENKCKELSEYYGCSNVQVSIKDVEKTLIEINKLWDEPRCMLGDIVTYTRSVFYRDNRLNNILCEGGADQLLFSDPNKFIDIMILAIKRKEYDIHKALSVRGTYIPKLNFIEGSYSDSYINTFFKDAIFSDNELIAFGLPIPKLELKKDTIADLTQCLFDWYYVNWTKNRNDIINNHLGLNIYSPFEEHDLSKFCLSLPMEMKFCLGNGKHIMKEAISLPNEVKSMLISRIYPILYDTVKRESLFDKYIGDKNMTIFNYLDYDLVQKFDFLKRWQLLNLSIWFEVHK